MECSKVQSMIEPFLNGQLNDADKNGFINHVRNCKTCYEELEAYHVIYSVVDQLDSNTEDKNIDYKATLEQKLTSQESGVKRRKLYRQLAWALAAAIVMAAASYAFITLL